MMYIRWTGRKMISENLAVLPTMIYGVNEDGTPQLAQWNYNILAHPLNRSVPLNRCVDIYIDKWLCEVSSMVKCTTPSW